MKHLVVITFYFVCIIMGCTAHNDIYSYVKEQVETSGNQISFNKFSEENRFEWDTLYFFSAKASLEEINKTFPVKVNDFVDVGDRIYFLKNKQIIYSECWYSVEFNKAKGISISASDTILKCTSMDAIFNIEKKNGFFILTPQ